MCHSVLYPLCNLIFLKLHWNWLLGWDSIQSMLKRNEHSQTFASILLMWYFSPWRPPEICSSCTGHCWCHLGWKAGLQQSCSAGPGQSCWRSICWSPTSSELCLEPPPGHSHGSTGRSNGRGIHSNAVAWYNLKCDRKQKQDFEANLFEQGGKVSLHTMSTHKREMPEENTKFCWKASVFVAHVKLNWNQELKL